MEQQIKKLPEQDRRLVKMYMQLSPEKLDDKMEQFSEQMGRAKDDKKGEEYGKQVKLHFYAKAAKQEGIDVKGGKTKHKRRRRLALKKKLTRRKYS